MYSRLVSVLGISHFCGILFPNVCGIVLPNGFVCKHIFSASNIAMKFKKMTQNDRSGIRTHATEVTGALNQRLRPLGHPVIWKMITYLVICSYTCRCTLAYKYIRTFLYFLTDAIVRDYSYLVQKSEKFTLIVLYILT